MNTEQKLKQGNSYFFVCELRDDEGNILQLSDFDMITVLITSPSIHRVIIREPDYRIDNNKLVFELSENQTRFFRNSVQIEAELRKGKDVVVATPSIPIPVESNNISKLK